MEQRVIELLEDILKELKNISEYTGYKKQKEMWERNLAKELPKNSLQLDEEKEIMRISKDFYRAKLLHNRSNFAQKD